MSNEDHSYNGNPNLKPIDYQHTFTVDQVKELMLCSQDPIYFIETYCRIVSLDKGIVPFKLYDCQKEKVGGDICHLQKINTQSNLASARSIASEFPEITRISFARSTKSAASASLL